MKKAIDFFHRFLYTDYVGCVHVHAYVFSTFLTRRQP